MYVRWTRFIKIDSLYVTTRRMGSKEEGMMRWMWVLLDGMEENDLESPKAGQGSVVLSLCADSWENRGSE